EIRQIEKQISSEASKNENVKILMSMTGIDYFSVMLINSEIGDISRFSTAENWYHGVDWVQQYINLVTRCTWVE
ncbi:MAG TPA: hypothetical protein VLA74_14540, partial [Nitrososphaeraceae archaeon]|nr:hypothetical protein [Nitrososphaeraceae archaeon]